MRLPAVIDPIHLYSLKSIPNVFERIVIVPQRLEQYLKNIVYSLLTFLIAYSDPPYRGHALA